jgi:hypothetical protein
MKKGTNTGEDSERWEREKIREGINRDVKLRYKVDEVPHSHKK